ncbi:unnamed protein product [Coregonus sp. 'balchen']|nr:unnamed protein product [Coregonus sp. 'balchen']
MNSENSQRIGNGHGGKVKGGVGKKSGHAHRKSLNDSLEGEVKAFLIDEGQLHTYDDLTKVNPVTPTTVLKCLQARYSAKVFYTHAGCTLVALNPFQPVPDLYSLDVMKEYHCAPQPQESKPHIFIVAEEAYRNVQGQVEPVNQSLVVSGESGAGKTWTSRCLMKYYATVAASSSLLKRQETVERIEKRVLDSNPVMEAFGGSDEQRRDWKMPHDQRFVWLPNADKTLEEDCFDETVDAMVHLGINAEKQGHIFRILAGLLQLGNVTFCSAMDESQPCDLEKQSKVFVQRCAALLCVPVDELQTCLRVRTLRAGKQSALFKPCSLADCSVRRDCLAKVIYAQLFEWLVTFINDSICADNSTWCNFIGGVRLRGIGVVECLLNRASDAKQFRVRLEKELSDNSSMSWDKFGKLPHFTVAHYAGKVSYQIEGMMEKNKLFADRDPADQGTRGLRQVVTVVSKFKNSLESLMKILHSTTPHYTRCIKPNTDCRPLTFVKEERYGLISNWTLFSQGAGENGLEENNKDDLGSAVANILRVVLKSNSLDPSHHSDSETRSSLVHCGRTKVFLTNSTLELMEEGRNRVRSQRAFSIQCCWHRHKQRRRHAARRASTLIQAVVRSWLALMDALAEAELDDAEDLQEEAVPPELDPILRARGLVQLSSIQEPVMVRGWPMGLALASAPTVTVSMTATGFQKMMSVMACLNGHCFRTGEYKVETNQFKQGVASIRAQPRGSIKLHYQRSPLLYADMHPDNKHDGVTGLNQILLEDT